MRARMVRRRAHVNASVMHVDQTKKSPPRRCYYWSSKSKFECYIATAPTEPCHHWRWLAKPYSNVNWLMSKRGELPRVRDVPLILWFFVSMEMQGRQLCTLINGALQWTALRCVLGGCGHSCCWGPGIFQVVARLQQVPHPSHPSNPPSSYLDSASKKP